jgi:hypothetical protein
MVGTKAGGSILNLATYYLPPGAFALSNKAQMLRNPMSKPKPVALVDGAMRVLP